VALVRSRPEPVDPFVSVVVPTYNRRASLQRLLEALGRQTYPADRFEVVVVDDGSTDGTAEMVRRLTLPYALRLLQPGHGGPSRARNLGVEAAGGTLVVFVDDDVVPVSALIAEHVASHREAPEAVVIGPMSPPGDWPRPAWVRWHEEGLQEQYQAMLAGKYPCSPRQFYTANVSLPRARFLDAGGFDAAFKRNEDLELAYRLDAVGAAFVFNPRADVLHYAAHTLPGWRKASYLYGRTDVEMSRDKGLPAFELALREFHLRHPLNRLAARVCVGRGLLYRAAVLALSGTILATDRLKLARPASLAVSALFMLLYWQGAADELGGRDRLWQRIMAQRTDPSLRPG
jgi:glycosyltransferase involved in cell wall biosynthesis